MKTNIFECDEFIIEELQESPHDLIDTDDNANGHGMNIIHSPDKIQCAFCKEKLEYMTKLDDDLYNKGNYLCDHC